MIWKSVLPRHIHQTLITQREKQRKTHSLARLMCLRLVIFQNWWNQLNCARIEMDFKRRFSYLRTKPMAWKQTRLQPENVWFVQKFARKREKRWSYISISVTSRWIVFVERSKRLSFSIISQPFPVIDSCIGISYASHYLYGLVVYGIAFVIFDAFLFLALNCCFFLFWFQIVFFFLVFRWKLLLYKINWRKS